VKQQADAGVDIVNDGEEGKVAIDLRAPAPHRWHGRKKKERPCGGGPNWAISEAPREPSGGPRWPARPERPSREGSRSSGQGPPNLRAPRGRQGDRGVMTAASPGVIAHFLPNSTIRAATPISPGRRRDEGGVRRHPPRGLRACRSTARSGHGPSTWAFRASNAESCESPRQYRGANHALRDIPPIASACISAGELPGAASLRHPSGDHPRRPQARPQGCLRGRQCRQSTVGGVREVPLPDDKVHFPACWIPRPFHRAPELGPSASCATRKWSGASGDRGSDCGFATFARSTWWAESPGQARLDGRGRADRFFPGAALALTRGGANAGGRLPTNQIPVGSDMVAAWRNSSDDAARRDRAWDYGHGASTI